MPIIIRETPGPGETLTCDLCGRAKTRIVRVHPDTDPMHSRHVCIDCAGAIFLAADECVAEDT